MISLVIHDLCIFFINNRYFIVQSLKNVAYFFDDMTIACIHFYHRWMTSYHRFGTKIWSWRYHLELDFIMQVCMNVIEKFVRNFLSIRKYRYVLLVNVMFSYVFLKDPCLVLFDFVFLRCVFIVSLLFGQCWK